MYPYAFNIYEYLHLIPAPLNGFYLDLWPYISFLLFIIIINIPCSNKGNKDF